MTTFRIKGILPDQRGVVRQGRITGYNGNGIPCRRYTWIKPVVPELKGEHFEAFDDQINNARKEAY